MHGHVSVRLKWTEVKEVKDLRGQSLGNSFVNVEAAKKSARSSDGGKSCWAIGCRHQWMNATRKANR